MIKSVNTELLINDIVSEDHQISEEFFNILGWPAFQGLPGLACAINSENSGAARSKSRSPSSPSPPRSMVPDRSGSASVGHLPCSDNAPGLRHGPSCSSQPHEVHCICLSDKDVGHMIECEGCSAAVMCKFL